MTIVKRTLRAIAMSTGRLGSLYQAYGVSDHYEWAEFLRRHRGVKIGRNTTVNPHAVFMDRDMVEIGAHCSISTGIFVTHSGFDRVIQEMTKRPLVHLDRSIKIGDYCGIGWGATIIGPVEIGERSFIAAGAIVTRNVPPGMIVGGCNKVIKLTSQHVRDRTHWTVFPQQEEVA
jgi:acetyltransferase-like isoleucine patch superfamily enzyme